MLVLTSDICCECNLYHLLCACRARLVYHSISVYSCKLVQYLCAGPMMSQRRIYPFRIGHWLSKDPKAVQEEWLKKLKETVRTHERDLAGQPIALQLDPIIQKFKTEVEKDATLHMQYTQMFTEASTAETGTPQVKNYDEMFLLVNYIMKNYTPPYSQKVFPINIILNWVMGTTNGYAAFLNEKANGHWKKVLDKWQNDVLKTEKSLHVLNDDNESGWLGKQAMFDMTEGGDLQTFVELFECNPDLPHLGFKCWDNFFTRRFRKNARPIEEGADPAVINNACESYPYSLQKNVQLTDEFWIKEHKYSLQHMFNNEGLASRFVGGTVYQAYLSVLSYHRWHSPIKGTVIETKVIPGTYYSVTLCVGPDEASPYKSQPGDEVEKGQEIGMFHFGGSTHCLIFRPGVNLRFIDRVYTDLDGNDDNDSEYNIHVNAKLATVV